MLLEIVLMKTESANVEPRCSAAPGVNVVTRPNDRLVRLPLDFEKEVEGYDKETCEEMLEALAHDQRNLEKPAGLFQKKAAEMAGLTVEEHRHEKREFLARRVEIVRNRLREVGE